MTQKLTEDVKIMKMDNESRIGQLEISLEEIKGNLRNLVDISREAMNNSVEGLKMFNVIIADQRA